MTPGESPAERALVHAADGRWDQAIYWLNRAEAGERRQFAGDQLAAAMIGALRSVTNDQIERTLLLAESGRLSLGAEQREHLVETWISRLSDAPERAMAAARYCPEAPSARSLLAQFGQEATAPGPVRVIESSRPATATHGAVRSPFRSEAERIFCARIDADLAPLRAYPNVAISAVIDFAAVRGLLVAAERDAFFRLVVDTLIVDEAGGTLLFVELDGPAHRDAQAEARDRLKDRIVATAGGRLLRLRLDRQYEVDQAVALVRQLLAT